MHPVLCAESNEETKRRGPDAKPDGTEETDDGYVSMRLMMIMVMMVMMMTLMIR